MQFPLIFFPLKTVCLNSILVKDFHDGSTSFQAPSKEVVHRLCNEAFLYRHDKKKPKEVVQAASENLSIEIQDAQDVSYVVCVFFLTH